MLSTMVFGSKKIVAVDLNGDIIDTVNHRFGEFSGHLDRLPEVTFVADEARSFIARQDERFDIIQISWIDTFAATSAGAFTLSENSLYTIESWGNFFDHLRPDGILAVSRHYREEDPREAARLVALARASLQAWGVQDPGRRVLLFSILLASRLGSYLTGKPSKLGLRRQGFLALAGLVTILLLVGWVTPAIVSRFAAASTSGRSAISVAILAVQGISMGMPFALGMKVASERDKDLTLWLWGIHGAFSVGASVLAVVIALEAGIAASYWTGWIAYGIALLAFMAATGRDEARPSGEPAAP